MDCDRFLTVSFNFLAEVSLTLRHGGWCRPRAAPSKWRTYFEPHFLGRFRTRTWVNLCGVEWREKRNYPLVASYEIDKSTHLFCILSTLLLKTEATISREHCLSSTKVRNNISSSEDQSPKICWVWLPLISTSSISPITSFPSLNDFSLILKLDTLDGTDVLGYSFCSPIKSEYQSRLASGSPNSRYEPTLSRIMHLPFPLTGLSPLPTCCKYFTSDLVGRASCINSISGQSKPSENISTFHYCPV